MNFRVISLTHDFSPFYFKTKKAALEFMATRKGEVALQRGFRSEWSTWNGKYYEPSNYHFDYLAKAKKS
jgi:hypothetical protein